MGVEIKEVVLLDVDDIFPNDWNPNEQSTTTFTELSKEIGEDGFDDPIKVVPWPDHPECAIRKKMMYKIVDGEHRWRIMKLKQELKIPCVIYESWDEETQKLKTVRRNLLTGKLNPHKFTELLRNLQDRHSFKPREDYRKLGFESYEELARHLEREREEKAKSWMEAMTTSASKEKDAVTGLSDILNTIFKDAGDTVEKNYLFFTYKGQMHLMTVMTPGMYKLTEEMVAFLRANSMNINEFMFDAIKRRLDASKTVSTDETEETES